MEKNKQEILQLLLNLHKNLLEGQKIEYENAYGTIGNANQYFQLVISHEDFGWLRKLSALIASYEEGLESDNQDVLVISKDLVSLLSGSGDQEFYQRLQALYSQTVKEIVAEIIESLKKSCS